MNTKNQIPISLKFLKGIRSKTQCTSPPSSLKSSRLMESVGSGGKMQTSFSEVSLNSQKVEFIASIINKIKNVQRTKPQVNNNTNDNQLHHLQKQLNQQSKNAKQTDQSIRSKLFMQYVSEYQNGQLIQKKYRNIDLEKKLQQVRTENKQLKDIINSMGLSLSFLNEQYAKILSQSKNKQQYILQLQKTAAKKQIDHQSQLQAMLTQIQINNRQLQIAKTSQSFKIQQSVDEVIFPSENVALFKAQQEIRQLKMELISLQKKYFQSISALQRQKNQQIKIFRKALQGNLNRQKSKSANSEQKIKKNTKNRMQYELQTTIQVCSAQQS